MSKTVEVRNIVIGEGTPKICVPILADTKQKIWEAAAQLEGQPYDLVEWRADYFDHLLDPDEVKEVLIMLRSLLGDTPILFTVRSKKEGGNREISIEDYINVNLEAIHTGLIDLVDVQVALGDDISFMIVEASHDAGIKVIGSSHDFQKTPKKEEIIMCLCKMQELETDIAKFAVMPQNARDVLTLLDATLAMVELHDDTPVVTMAMGELGKVSRIAGGVFGSAITFGSAGTESAPGQIPLKKLQVFLDYL